LFNAIFPFLHLAALLAAGVYAIISLVQGNVPRFGLIVVLLAIYYVFILHPAVKKEIERRRSLRR
jgi:Ca2+/Na+ antiporter